MLSASHAEPQNDSKGKCLLISMVRPASRILNLVSSIQGIVPSNLTVGLNRASQIK